MRYGGKTRWFKILLVSNKPPEEHEFKDMMDARIKGKEEKLTMNLIRNKKADIKNAKNYDYNPEEID